MRISRNSHLCYCMNNFKPAEDFSGKSPFFTISEKLARALEVLEQEQFAIGIWANEKNLAFLEKPDVFAEFARIASEKNFYFFTMNIFPFGDFHGARVKENVYLPDWRSDERLDYSCRAADFLSKIIPEDVTGSLSTVPGGYRNFISDPSDISRIAVNLAKAALHLRKAYERTGKKIVLAIEPEPDCIWEDAADFADFFGRELAANDDCREYIGLCYDTSHHELSGLNPGEGIDLCLRNGVKIAKIQLSAALGAPTPESKKSLANFADDVYLHQTREVKENGVIVTYQDLPQALEQADHRRYWKIHYHIPLYLDSLPGGLSVEKNDLEAVLRKLAENPAICSNIEIETYTFPVLPEEIRKLDIEKSMALEYQWVLDRLKNSEHPTLNVQLQNKNASARNGYNND